MEHQYSLDSITPGSRSRLHASIGLIFQLIAISAVAALLPCIIDFTGFALSWLLIQLEAAESNARLYGHQKYNNLFSKFSVEQATPCSEQYSTSAKVYLTASELSLSNVSSSPTTGPGSLADHIVRDVPLVELLQRYPTENRAELYKMHWTIVIRGMVYELLRVKGRRGVALKATPFSSYVEADALGLPLRLAWVEEIGTTYLSDQSILRLAQKAVARNPHYNPLLHSCQTIWTEEVLPRIVCQCSEQPPLELPVNTLDFTSRRVFWFIVLGLSAFIVDFLVMRDFIPSIAVCKRTSRIGLLCREASKYWIFMRSLQSSIYRVSKEEPIPLQEVPDLERKFDEELKTDDWLQAAYWANIKKRIREEMHDVDDHVRFVHFGKRLGLLSWIYVLALPLSSVISYMSKTRMLWYFHFLDTVFFAFVVRQLFLVSSLVELTGFPSLRHCDAQSWMGNEDMQTRQPTGSGER